MTTATINNVKSVSTLFNTTIPQNLVIDGPRLLNKDLCEYRCGQAYVRFISPDSSLELLMCGSHARRSIASMIEKNWLIDDQTHYLMEDNRHKGEL